MQIENLQQICIYKTQSLFPIVGSHEVIIPLITAVETKFQWWVAARMGNERYAIRCYWVSFTGDVRQGRRWGWEPPSAMRAASELRVTAYRCQPVPPCYCRSYCYEAAGLKTNTIIYPCSNLCLLQEFIHKQRQEKWKLS